MNGYFTRNPKADDIWRFGPSNQSGHEGMGHTKPSNDNVLRSSQKTGEKIRWARAPHIPRAQNQAADDLAKIGSTRGQIPPGIYLEHLHAPTVREDTYLEADPDMLPDDNIPDKEDIPAVVDLLLDVEVVPPEWTLPI